MRTKKNLGVRLERCAPWIVQDPRSCRGDWRSKLCSCTKLCVELGTGKGKFLTETAVSAPDTLFIGVERVPGALVMAAEKARDLGLRNILFIIADASDLSDMFEENEIDRIYLNFSDPWPPRRQAKRRLTHRNFLTLYRHILAPEGDIHFKTDNRGLFEFSLNEMSDFGMRLSSISLDLHASGAPNVTTEYEERFAAEGMPIYRLEARFGEPL